MSNLNFDQIVNMLDSPIEDERQNAVIELVKLNSINVIPVLRKVSTSDESIKIRYYAKKGLQFLKARIKGPDEKETYDLKSESLSQIKKILNDVFLNHDIEERINLIQSLIKNERKDVLSELVFYTETDQDAFVVSKLIIALGILGDDSYIPIIKRFIKNSDFRIRANAIEALGYIGSDEIVPFLLACLEDSDNRVKANAVKELKKFGIDIITKTLDQMVSSNEIWMRDSAVNALNEICTERFLPHLIKLLNDPKEVIRAQAFKGIQKLSERGVVLAQEISRRISDCKIKDNDITTFLNLVNSDISNNIIKELSDSDFKKRLNAVYSILKDKKIECIDLLMVKIRTEQDQYVKAVMITVLSRMIKNEQTKKIFLSHISDENPRVRANSVEALSGYQGEDVKEAISGYLDDENNRVRGNAILGMMHFSGFDPTPHLKKMIISENVLLKSTAIYVITEIATDESIALLELLIDEYDSDIKSKVISSLKIIAESGNKKANQLLKKIVTISDSEETGSNGEFTLNDKSIEVDKLIFDLADDNDHIKVNALKILADIGDETCLEKLTPLFKDPTESVRKLSADVFNQIKKRVNFEKHLSELGAKDTAGISADKMLILLNDSNRDIRLSAVMKIRLGDSSILFNLKNRLKIEKDLYVLSALVNTIGMLGGSEDVEAISPYINHDDSRVRANAVEGLSYTGAQKAISFIVMALNDTSNRTVNNARRALKLFNSSNLFHECSKMLELHEDEIVDLIIQTASVVGGDFSKKILILIIIKSRSDNRIIEAARLLNPIFTSEDILLIEGELNNFKSDDVNNLRLSILNYFKNKFLVNSSLEELIDNINEKAEYNSQSEKKKSSVQKIVEKGKLKKARKSDKNSKFLNQIAISAKPDSVDINIYKKIDGSSKLSLIINNILDDLIQDDEDLRKAAVIKLSKINDPRIIEILKQVIQNDSSTVVKFFAKRYIKMSMGKGILPSVKKEGLNHSEEAMITSGDRDKLRFFLKFFLYLFCLFLLFVGGYFVVAKYNIADMFMSLIKSDKKDNGEKNFKNHIHYVENEKSKSDFGNIFESIKSDYVPNKLSEKLKSLIRWGAVFEKSGKWKKSGEQYYECLKEDDTLFEINLRMIRAYKLSGNKDFLVDHYSKKKKTNFNIYFLSLSQNSKDKALNLLHKIENDKSFIWPKFTLGLILLKEQKYEEAIKYFIEFIKRKTDYPDVLLPLSYCFYKSNYIDESLKSLSILLGFRPYMAKISHLQGLINLLNKDEKKALSFLKKSVSKTDSDSLSLYDAALCSKKMKKYELAAKFYSKTWMLEKKSKLLSKEALETLLRVKDFVLAAELECTASDESTDINNLDKYLTFDLKKKIDYIFLESFKKDKNFEIFRKNPEIEYFFFE